MRRQWLEHSSDVDLWPTCDTDVKSLEVKVDQFLYKLEDLITKTRRDDGIPGDSGQSSSASKMMKIGPCPGSLSISLGHSFKVSSVGC